MQGNYLSSLLGSNLSKLKRLRRSSLTFFLKHFHHDARRPLSSPTLYSITTIVDIVLLHTRYNDIIRYDIRKRLVLPTTLVTTKCILPSAHQKNDRR